MTCKPENMTRQPPMDMADCPYGDLERSEPPVDSDSLFPKLEKEGYDIEGATKRIMGDDAFYLHLLEAFYRERTWEELKSALEKKDYEAAFQTAHLIKGSAATLGLTPIYESAGRIVEKLRRFSRQSEDGQEAMTLSDVDYSTFQMRIQHFVELCESCL